MNEWKTFKIVKLSLITAYIKDLNYYLKTETCVTCKNTSITYLIPFLIHRYTSVLQSKISAFYNLTMQLALRDSCNAFQTILSALIYRNNRV